MRILNNFDKTVQLAPNKLKQPNCTGNTMGPTVCHHNALNMPFTGE